MLTIIAALAKNRIVGKNNKMPWHISEDFQHFKKTTLNHPIIMGRKTFESIDSKPLPGRPHVIISRTMPQSNTVDVCRTLEEAITRAKTYHDEIFVCGGVEIYKQALPLANRMILSHLNAEYDGDAYFPEFDESEWIVTKKDVRSGFTIVYYERKK